LKHASSPPPPPARTLALCALCTPRDKARGRAPFSTCRPMPTPKASRSEEASSEVLERDLEREAEEARDTRAASRRALSITKPSSPPGSPCLATRLGEALSAAAPRDEGLTPPAAPPNFREPSRRCGAGEELKCEFVSLLAPMGLSREEGVREVLLSRVLLLPLTRRLADAGVGRAVAEPKASARRRGVFGDREDRVRGSTSSSSFPCSHTSCSCRWRAS